MEKDRKTGNSYPDCFAAVLPGLSVFYAVISAYVVNYRLKIGTYHVWLCSAVGAAAVVFSVWAIILCAGLLIRKKGKKGYIVNDIRNCTFSQAKLCIYELCAD
ncbi:MAG: hypothetical protein IIU25_02780 [Oscillospiraceae bacterium]|nr:hypothetical protein [Oscillospiraceae bacterium]